MRTSYFTGNHHRVLLALLALIWLIRLGSLGIYPLADTTEARYGEIARLMLVSGDWITPQLSLGVPFWGKPPMSFWLSAMSMKIFGVGEFAARLPSFLLGIAVSALVYCLAVRESDRNHALASIVILNSSLFFWISSGAVMTDHTLLLGTTLAMVGFRLALTAEEKAGRRWGYLFFAGIAIGLLGKGPVALVLIGLPVFCWTILTRNVREVLRRLPVKSGLLLTAVLALPWYGLAEAKTPGFLNYFLIGEHWKRFLVPGWEGDLYGSAHDQPRGMIWLYWLACILPWSLVSPLGLLRDRFRRADLRLSMQLPDQWTLYLVLWAVAPLVFFSMTHNILPAYVLPGLPALSLLLARQWSFQSDESKRTSSQWLVGTAFGMVSVFLLACILVNFGFGPSAQSQKELVSAFTEQRGEDGELVYLFHRPFSALFYSQGKAGIARTMEDAKRFFGNGAIDYFALSNSRFEKTPTDFQTKVTVVGRFHGHLLVRENFL